MTRSCSNGNAEKFFRCGKSHFTARARADFPPRINQTIPALSGAPVTLRFYMIKWAVIFLIVALVAGVLGFTGIAGAAVAVAKFLFFLFIGIFVLLLILGLFIGNKLTK